jgi:4-hydroxybenzoate polyprenyltransferase
MAQTKRIKQRHRTYARNRPRRRISERVAEADGVYFLKLVVVVLLATMWLKFTAPLSWHGIPLAAFPLGALVALIGIKLLEKDQYDRKIWFAVLVIVMIISYFVPAGIVI